MSKRKKTPEFKTEAEERTFWETHDSSGQTRFFSETKAVNEDDFAPFARSAA